MGREQITQECNKNSNFTWKWINKITYFSERSIFHFPLHILTVFMCTFLEICLKQTIEQVDIYGDLLQQLNFPNDKKMLCNVCVHASFHPLEFFFFLSSWKWKWKRMRKGHLFLSEVSWVCYVHLLSSPTNQPFSGHQLESIFSVGDKKFHHCVRRGREKKM